MKVYLVRQKTDPHNAVVKAIKCIRAMDFQAKVYLVSEKSGIEAAARHLGEEQARQFERDQETYAVKDPNHP